LGDWLHPYAVYDFTLSRERDGPAKFLAGFAGYLQSHPDCVWTIDAIRREERRRKQRVPRRLRS
jgi:hypothetical protein